jgi:pimeloyl-ACP methyl ester carboxylesterase
VSAITATRTLLELPDRVVQLERGGDGPPVLYLHGALGEGYWLDFHDELAARGFEVIVPAHPGYWESTRPEWVRTPADLALHCVDLLDALGLDRVAVAGSSLGAWVAAELAILRPDRLAAMVLLGPLGLAPEDREPPDLFALQPFEAAEVLFADPETEMARLLASIDLDDPPDAELVLPILQTFEATARYAWRPYDPRLAARLRFAAVPALVLTGSEDAYLEPGTAERWAARLPDARTGTIARAGHLPALERPLEAAEAVAGFLRAGWGKIEP